MSMHDFKPTAFCVFHHTAPGDKHLAYLSMSVVSANEFAATKNKEDGTTNWEVVPVELEKEML